MSQTYTCGDPGALVSYLYDECAPHQFGALEVAYLFQEHSATEVIIAVGVATRAGQRAFTSNFNR